MILSPDEDIEYPTLLNKLSRAIRFFQKEGYHYEDAICWIAIFQQMVGILETNKFMMALTNYDMRISRFITTEERRKINETV